MVADVKFLSVSLTPGPPETGPAGVMPAISGLVQLNDVLAVRDVGVYVNAVLLQRAGGVRVLFRAGVGLTVMVKLCGVPAHPSNEGVTVMVAVTGAVPELVAVNDAILPLPLAASPIEGVLLVQA